MARVLVIADEPWVRSEVHAALTEPAYTLIDHDDSRTAAARAGDEEVDAVITDLQVGTMGGMAVARELRDRDAMAGREFTPVVILLDRAADAFLAKRAGAAAWVIKPFTTAMIREALQQAMGG
jgi:two-component system OmpR family response regulator